MKGMNDRTSVENRMKAQYPAERMATLTWTVMSPFIKARRQNPKHLSLSRGQKSVILYRHTLLTVHRGQTPHIRAVRKFFMIHRLRCTIPLGYVLRNKNLNEGYFGMERLSLFKLPCETLSNSENLTFLSHVSTETWKPNLSSQLEYVW